MIDYGKLAHAMLVAETTGYKVMHVDWVCPDHVCDITRPPEAKPINVRSQETFFNGQLIASGEVGLLNHRFLFTEPDQKLVTCTPCFRSEPTYTHGLYEPWFMKVELMIANPVSPDTAIKAIREDAKRIMGTWTRKLQVNEENGDLELNGIEVGSYGYREWEGFHWIYGTALAEPRFSYALKGGKL